jgi:hypothetical protein
MHPNQPNRRLIPVSPEVVKLEIQLIDAKLGMQEQKREALKTYSKETRKLVKAFIQTMTAELNDEINEWTTAGNALEKHELAIIDVTIAELNRDLAVAKRLLQECEEETKRLLT